MTRPANSSDLAAGERAKIVTRLLEWYRAHRRDLPWRGASPYAVWVSEIMLQQTQVTTVIPYYNRFLARFPTIEALSEAPIDEVLRHWAGLGYYARARNLHRAAQIVMERHGGRIPDTSPEIAALPGIGRYTAGAILSIAYGLPQPIVDGNVIRVLSRLFGLRGDPKSAANQSRLWSLAAQLVPDDSPGDFNQGLMELGALICAPADPRCEQCPLLSRCVAGNSPDPTILPEIPPGRAGVPITHSAALVEDESGRVLIAQRPPHGLWGGLWEFPRVACKPGETPQEGAVRAAHEVTGLTVRVGRRVGRVKHAVTHYRITLYGFAAQAADTEQRAMPVGCAALRWERHEALAEYAFSAPQALLRDALRSAATQPGALQAAMIFEEIASYEPAAMMPLPASLETGADGR